MPQTEFQLSNGLALLVRENHDAPVATADIWVRAGSGDETPEIGGISHFLEHMLFKGTDKFATGEIEREIENCGGQCNAATSYDYTHYYVTMPAARIGRGIDMLAEMTRASALDATELEKERLVILEEWRRKQDNPAAMLYEDLFELCFNAGPYHRSVIGTDDTIRAITRPQMEDYYHRHYAPENMALVIAGDVDPEAVREEAERTFGALGRSFKPLLERREPSAAATGIRHHREKETGGELYLAFALPASGAGDIAKILAEEMAETILGHGRASILFQEIKERRRLASTIGCSFSTLRDHGLFSIIATCEPAKRAELADAVRGELEKFAERIPSAEQFTRARRLLTSSYRFMFERSSGAASAIGYNRMIFGSTELLDEYVERLAEVTPEQVRAGFAALLAQGPLNEISVGPTA